MNKINLLKIKLLNTDSKAPSRIRDTDAGYDFFANNRTTINSGAFKLVSTGISIKLPNDTWMLIKDRSSFATKTGLMVFAGVIDDEYTGEIKILLFNATQMPITIEKNEKFAQGIIIPMVKSQPKIVDSLEQTNRNSQGFGSTGNK